MPDCQDVARLEFRDRDDVVVAPGPSGLQHPGCRVLGLIGPGQADGVHAIVGLVDQQHVQQIVRVDRVGQVEGAAVMVAPSPVVPSTSTQRTALDVIEIPSTRSMSMPPILLSVDFEGTAAPQMTVGGPPTFTRWCPVVDVAGYRRLALVQNALGSF